jgi:hypothetical protein
MKKLLITSLILMGCINYGFAQSNREEHTFGITFNVSNRQFADALSWTHYYGIGKNRRFKVGYGIRLTNYFSSEQNYITAPAKYTSGKQSIVALFTENIEKNLDTLNFTKTQVNFLNAGIYLCYTLPFFKDRLQLGVNIDAIGLSVGMKQGGTFTSSSRNAAVSAKPTALNLLLISDSDYGSLNSEWYVCYWVSKKWGVKAGYEFLFTEYKTDSKVQKIPDSAETNDRFRNKSRMIMAGIVYAPFRK